MQAGAHAASLRCVCCGGSPETSPVVQRSWEWGWGICGGRGSPAAADGPAEQRGSAQG